MSAALATDSYIQDGHISYDQFIAACDSFLTLAKELNDPWVLEGNSEAFCDRYLSATYIRRLKNEQNAELINCRYDVTYSLSHSVPVLYFVISRTTGKSLTLDEVWTMLGNNLDESHKTMWNIISQQDHPVLHTPFFCIHPCHTWKILSECFHGKHPTPTEYLVSWLSIVGNTFGLRLSNHYLNTANTSTEQA